MRNQQDREMPNINLNDLDFRFTGGNQQQSAQDVSTNEALKRIMARLGNNIEWDKALRVKLTQIPIRVQTEVGKTE